MIEQKCLCDQCGNDITYTGNSVDWRISLKSEQIPITPGAAYVTDMMIFPPVENLHFCSTKCLKEFVEKRIK